MTTDDDEQQHRRLLMRRFLSDFRRQSSVHDYKLPNTLVGELSLLHRNLSRTCLRQSSPCFQYETGDTRRQLVSLPRRCRRVPEDRHATLMIMTTAIS